MIARPFGYECRLCLPDDLSGFVPRFFGHERGVGCSQFFQRQLGLVPLPAAVAQASICCLCEIRDFTFYAYTTVVVLAWIMDTP